MSIDFAWAKLASDGSALAVADHGIDVAAVLRALLAPNAYGRALAATAERALSPRDIERLCLLAFLHDMGKCNRGFWMRQFPKARRIGHTNELATLFEGSRVAALNELLDIVFDDWGGGAHFTAVMAHHGRPLEFLSSKFDPHAQIEPGPHGKPNSGEKLWQPDQCYDPVAALEQMIAVGRRAFPRAFEPGPPLPQEPRFVSLYAGLMTLADWIGSDSARFVLGGATGEQRPAFAAKIAAQAVHDLGLTRRDWGSGDAGAIFDFPLREAQHLAASPDLGDVAVLEAGTGSGKTEAALWRFVQLARAGKVDGLYFALPTRTAAVQLHGRLTAFFAKLCGPEEVEPVLAVPGYIRAGQSDGQMLAPFEVLWPDTNDPHPERWAAESPKRYLAARVAVGTIDQALLAGLQVRHAHLRAAALSRTLLVVDEVHASDPYMSEILKTVIDNHLANGGQVMLLSATLGGELRAALTGTALPRLAEAEQIPYPAISGTGQVPRKVSAGPDKAPVKVQLQGWMADPEQVAAAAVAAAMQGASVLVVRNRVDDAIAVARAVEALGGPCFTLNGVATLHHGRFAAEDRKRLDERVEEVFGKAKPGGRSGADRHPVVLCGTQTLEQSLDIDADYLITDLAPMDVLLQRLGRLHRHDRERPKGLESPRAMVLTPARRDLRPFEKIAQHGLGPLDDGTGIYPDLSVIEATWGLLEEWPDIAVPQDSRTLVERALHSEARALAAERAGLAQNQMNQQARILGEKTQARDALLDMKTPFETLFFPDALEGAVSTRLGARDFLVDLPQRPMGPFGAAVSRVKIPVWMVGEVGSETEPLVSAFAGGFALDLAGKRFTYDRLGLQKG